MMCIFKCVSWFYSYMDGQAEKQKKWGRSTDSTDRDRRLYFHMDC